MALILIASFILVSAILTLAETAVASSRVSRLEQAVRDGNRQARSALRLLQTPRRLLAAVRLLLLGLAILSGALAEAFLAAPVASWLTAQGLAPGAARWGGLVTVALGVTALMVLVGELLPRRFGFLYPEPIAVFLARPMRLISGATAPLTGLLDWLADVLLRLFDIRPPAEPAVTEEEIRVLIEQGAKAGVFEKAEQDIMTNVFRLGDRRASSLMTPRTEIVWLRLDATDEEIRRTIASNAHSNYPVGQESLDNIVGVLSAKDCLARTIAGEPIVIDQLMRKPLIVPEGISTLQLLEAFRESPQQVALIADEYGSILGMVSQNDVLEALVGDLPSPEEPGELPLAVRRDDGTWLIDAAMSADEFKDLMKLRHMPGESEYDTLGGFFLMQFQRIPRPSDHFEWNGLRFEVVDMDGKRIDKLLVSGQPAADTPLE